MTAACGNCAEPTLAEGVWRCVPCQRAGRDTLLCSPGCFYEHVADHDQVADQAGPRWLEHFESLPQLELLEGGQ